MQGKPLPNCIGPPTGRKHGLFLGWEQIENKDPGSGVSSQLRQLVIHGLIQTMQVQVLAMSV